MNLLERVKEQCVLKNLTLPKALLSENNPNSVNAYLSAEVKRIEERFAVSKKKIKMYQLAYEIISESTLN